MGCQNGGEGTRGAEGARAQSNRTTTNPKKTYRDRSPPCVETDATARTRNPKKENGGEGTRGVEGAPPYSLASATHRHFSVLSCIFFHMFSSVFCICLTLWHFSFIFLHVSHFFAFFCILFTFSSMKEIRQHPKKELFRPKNLFWPKRHSLPKKSFFWQTNYLSENTFGKSVFG